MDARRRVVSRGGIVGRGKGPKGFFPGWPITGELRMRTTNHRGPWRLRGGGEGSSCVLRGTISLRHSDIRSVSVLGRGFLASPALGSCIRIFPVRLVPTVKGVLIIFHYFFHRL